MHVKKLGAAARLWFALTAQERWLAAGLLAIVLIGLAARAAHVRHARAEVYAPEGIEEVEGP